MTKNNIVSVIIGIICIIGGAIIGDTTKLYATSLALMLIGVMLQFILCIKDNEDNSTNNENDDEEKEEDDDDED